MRQEIFCNYLFLCVIYYADRLTNLISFRNSLIHNPLKYKKRQQRYTNAIARLLHAYRRFLVTSRHLRDTFLIPFCGQRMGRKKTGRNRQERGRKQEPQSSIVPVI